jgi:hypothetical protein
VVSPINVKQIVPSDSKTPKKLKSFAEAEKGSIAGMKPHHFLGVYVF